MPSGCPTSARTRPLKTWRSFAEIMGDDKFWLYGESYGTQYAQTYAAVHPEHLAGLILDGTVDLTLSATDFLTGQAQAFNDVLNMTLSACNEDPACAESIDGGDAISAYNRLADALKQAPIEFDFPLASGGSRPPKLHLLRPGDIRSRLPLF